MTATPAVQVIDICKQVKQTIAVKRARFSALVPSEIKKAINGTVPPNKKEADAVEARSILDLRSGAAFTRFQTLLLQDRFDWQYHGVFQTDRAGNVREKLLVSFGSCQYPTLGLIVKRHWYASAWCFLQMGALLCTSHILVVQQILSTTWVCAV